MSRSYPKIEIRKLYDQFDAPVVPLDCGTKCAPHNPSGKPFCCDICHAVPSAYHQEWEYLQPNTNLWHLWRGDECTANPEDPAELLADTPDSMILLACLGPQDCQREYRALSCRQFPFFPYVTSDFRFLGLAYAWEFEDTCWVISNLDQVTKTYWQAFVQLYDDLFSLWIDEMEGYALRSEEMREHFLTQKRRIPILHRNGEYCLLNPINERITKLPPEKLPRFGVYHQPEE